MTAPTNSSSLRTESTPCISHSSYDKFVGLWESGERDSKRLMKKLDVSQTLLRSYKDRYLVELATDFMKRVNE